MAGKFSRSGSRVGRELERMGIELSYAIADGLSPGGDRAGALAMIRDLQAKSCSYVQDDDLLIVKRAAKLVLDRFDGYFNKMGVSLLKVMEALEQGYALDESIAKQLKEGADAMSALDQLRE